jgi:hypothetical protein
MVRGVKLLKVPVAQKCCKELSFYSRVFIITTNNQIKFQIYIQFITVAIFIAQLQIGGYFVLIIRFFHSLFIAMATAVYFITRKSRQYTLFMH